MTDSTKIFMEQRFIDNIFERLSVLEAQCCNARLNTLEKHYQETMSLIKPCEENIQRIDIFVNRMLGQAQAMNKSGGTMTAKSVEETLEIILKMLAELKQQLPDCKTQD